MANNNGNSHTNCSSHIKNFFLSIITVTFIVNAEIETGRDKIVFLHKRKEHKEVLVKLGERGRIWQKVKNRV